MNRFLVLLIVPAVALAGSSAQAGASEPTSAAAFCTLHLGTVSAVGQEVHLPSVTYPCP